MFALRALAAALALTALAACGGSEPQPAAKGVTTTNAPTAEAPSTAAPTGTTTTPPPVATTPTVTALPLGSPLSAAGAFLVAAFQPTVQSTQPPTAGCATLVDTGWTSDKCGPAEMAGGTRVWLVEKKAAVPSTLWRARILTWSQGKGAWLVDLAFTNEGAAPGKQPDIDLTAVNVKAADLTGDGKPELVFGYRSSGTGGYLAYDIVTDSPVSGPAVAAARNGLTKGQAAVAGGVITEYAGTSSNATPGPFDKSVVQYSAGVFGLVPSGQVPVGPGPLDL